MQCPGPFPSPAPRPPMVFEWSEELSKNLGESCKLAVCKGLRSLQKSAEPLRWLPKTSPSQPKPDRP